MSIVHNEDALSYMSKMKDNSIHFIHTDVPYYITEQTKVISSESGYNWCEKNKKWDEQWSNLKEYRKWLKKVVQEMIRILRPERHLVIWCNIRDISYITDIALKMKCTINPIWVWQKTNPVPQAAGVTPKKDIEVAVWIVKGNRKQKYYNKHYGAISQVLRCSIPRLEGSSIRHPSQKPLFICTIINLFLTKNKSKVFDPFSGSGSILVSAKSVGCNVLGCELDKKYYKSIVKRLKNKMDESIKYKVIEYLSSVGGNKIKLQKRFK